MTQKYVVEFYQDEEGGWNSQVPDLPGCVTCGSSLDQVRERIKEAMEDFVESLQARSITLQEPRYSAEVVAIEMSA